MTKTTDQDAPNAPDPFDLAETTRIVAELAERSQKLMQSFAARVSDDARDAARGHRPRAPVAGFDALDPLGISEVFQDLSAAMMRNPESRPASFAAP